MLPYASTGGYGGSPYGRRKGFLSSQNAVVGVLTVVAIAALGFSVFTHFRASSALAQRAAIRNELEGVRSELHSIKSQYSSRNAELEQLQVTYGHTQRRITELTSQLQRKEADVVSKDHALQQHIKERGVMDQHRSGREAELSKMVEDLRAELIRSDGVIEALDTKVAQMESTHSSREKDWHILANKWIKYEQDLHDQYKKCTDEVSKLRNITMSMNDTAPLPEAEPTLRPETDFGQIHTEVPVHKPHHFEPLAPPTPQAQPTDLPLPEPKIRDSVLAMTGGQVGGGEQASQQQQQSGSGSTAPEPAQVHHHDVYHGEHDDLAHLHNYDHYHGHYDSYDPMDEWWLHDAHGDWNADDAGHGHGGEDLHGGGHDAHHAYHHQQPEDNHNHHYEHHHQQPQDHHYQHHQEHQEQHDPYEHQRRQHYQEATGSGWAQPPQDAHHYHHPQQPPAMQGMDQHAQHAQHAPSHWQQPDPHQQQQQHQQHYQDPHQQHPQQQQQQQYGGEAHNHNQHPRGDLAYKMGW